MLRLGRLCAGPLARYPPAELGLTFARGALPSSTKSLHFTRNASTSTSSSSATKKSSPPPTGKGKASSSSPKSSLSPKPRAAEAAAPAAPKKVHEPKQRKHGRLSRKARSPTRTKWVKPAPRTPTSRSVARKMRWRYRLETNPPTRVKRFRLGFHVLRHSQPFQRGRRGRMSSELRRKIAKKGELQTRRSRKRYGRPEISLKRPRRWNMPLPEGILPAYDEALKLIRKDSYNVRKEANVLRREVDRLHRVLSGEVEGEKLEGEAKIAVEAALEAKRGKLHILDVQSEVNLPEVRWSVANAMTDMHIPSHRHLIEQRWRKDGDLDLLMERLHQMNVIPDVLPVMHPSVDLHVTARLMPTHFESLMKRNRFQRRVNTFKEVIPGNYLTPQQTRVPPKLYANVFHTDVRLYTMLLVDPDVPDPENQTYSTFLHWLKPNIPLSATHVGRIPLLNTHTRYVPPHPQRGTPYHRYTLLLLPQPPLPGMKYNRNTEALLTAQQERLSQSIRDSSNIAEARAEDVEKAVNEADGLSDMMRTGRSRTRHPTHPNAALPEPTSGEDPLNHFVTLSQQIDVPVIPDEQRLHFDVRAFLKQYGLNAAMGGGAHMWREVWDNYVGAVYRYDLHKPQPMYGRPPRDGRQMEAQSAAPTKRRKYQVGA
ncbi:hypothetical protein R3P38DRAFT_429814 [Favolaschia claudopus]|uniref:PEBP-like protein n=1 Tax=Favolaschia claudopus TaxID=2862362 RepID=A0AAW0CNL3_9AGAR